MHWVKILVEHTNVNTIMCYLQKDDPESENNEKSV